MRVLTLFLTCAGVLALALPTRAGGIYEVRRGGEHASHVNVPFAEPGALRSSPVSWGNCQGEC